MLVLGKIYLLATSVSKMTVEALSDFESPLSINKEKLLNIGPADMKLVLKHYKITEEEVKDMVRSIRDWLKKQPHLPGNKMKDQQIIGHLMFRGFSVEKVKSKLDDYMRAPHKMPDIVCQRDPLDPTVSEYLKRGYWTCMPKKTPEDYRVTVFRMQSSPKTTNNVASIVKIPFMLAEYRSWNDASVGECWIMDIEHSTLQDSLQMTPVLISNIIFLVLACFGARLKSVHILNAPSYAVPFINIFKSVAKKKIGDRVFVSTREELLHRFPKACLPNDYGGTGGVFKELADEWCKTLQTDAWRQHLIDLEELRTDESKRLVPLPDSEIFGADGSFRKMCID